MLYALHGGEAERDDVGDSKPCLKDDWALCQRQGQWSLFPLAEWKHFVGELRAAPYGQHAPAGSRRGCPLTVSVAQLRHSTVGELGARVELSGAQTHGRV